MGAIFKTDIFEIGISCFKFVLSYGGVVKVNHCIRGCAYDCSFSELFDFNDTLLLLLLLLQYWTRAAALTSRVQVT